MKSDLSRREFARFLGLTGSALWSSGSALARIKPKSSPPAPGANLCLYNSHREIERTLGAIQRWLATGV